MHAPAPLAARPPRPADPMPDYAANGTRPVFRVEALSAAPETPPAAFWALLNDCDADAEVRIAVERTNGIVSALVIGVRSRTPEVPVVDLAMFRVLMGGDFEPELA